MQQINPETEHRAVQRRTTLKGG